MTATVQIALRETPRRTIIIRTELEKFDERVKALPDARWIPKDRLWQLPATEGLALAVDEAFEEGYRYTPGFQRLRESARDARQAAEDVKRMKDVPDTPLAVHKPWAHQKRAYWFARTLEACMLAMGVGTGKSKIALDLMRDQRMKAALILCPLTAVEDVWPVQVDRHGGGAFTMLSLSKGSVAARADELHEMMSSPHIPGVTKLVLINYEAAWREPMDDALLMYMWDMVVLDESHRIKAAGGRSSNFLHRLGMKAARRRLCLTGTPFPHSPLDIYGQYRFLDPSIFGTRVGEFRARYAIFHPLYPSKVEGYQNEEELQKKFDSIALVVDSAVLDLPPEQDLIRTVGFEPKARKIYDRLEREFEAEVADGRITTNNALTKMLRMQQLTGGWAVLDALPGKKPEHRRVSTAKSWLLADVLKDLPENEPLVVFCRFTADIASVKEVCTASGRRVLELSGKRNELREWQGGGAPVLVVQIQAGAESIDLTRARYGIYFSLGSSLMQYTQSRGRIHRPGQTKTTIFIHLLLRHTQDEKVMKALQAREDVIESILRGIRTR